MAVVLPPHVVVCPVNTPSQPLTGYRPSLRPVPGPARGRSVPNRQAPFATAGLGPRGRVVAGRLPAALYWQRRLMVVVGLVAIVVAAYLLVAAVGAGRAAVVQTAGSEPVPGAATNPSTDATSAVPASPGAVYVVRPGDTLWSIARRIQPNGDLRALVDRLSERAGGGPLRAEQRIPLDGLAL
jgi:hypothetical protein